MDPDDLGIIPGEGEETAQYNIFRRIIEAELTPDHLKSFLRTHKYGHASKNDADFRGQL